MAALPSAREHKRPAEVKVYRPDGTVIGPANVLPRQRDGSLVFADDKGKAELDEKGKDEVIRRAARGEWLDNVDNPPPHKNGTRAMYSHKIGQ